jgi:hypothetical protein
MKRLVHILLVALMLIVTGLEELHAQTGCIAGNCKRGRGTYVYKNGDKYIGQFRDEYRNGEGRLIFANGDQLSGFFANDTIQGRATMKYTNGEVYSGQFKDNETREGYGVLQKKDSTRYEGNWKNNVQEGSGVLYKHDGTIVYGEWVNGQLSKTHPYQWKTDTTGDSYFCRTMRGIIPLMNPGLVALRANRLGNAKPTWAPKYYILGSSSATITYGDDSSAQVTYMLLTGGSAAYAHDVYDAIRNKLKICKPYDWTVKDDMGDLQPGEDLKSIRIVDKKCLHHMGTGKMAELRCEKNVGNGGYDITLKFINFDKK